MRSRVAQSGDDDTCNTDGFKGLESLKTKASYHVTIQARLWVQEFS